MFLTVVGELSKIYKNQKMKKKNQRGVFFFGPLFQLLGKKLKGGGVVKKKRGKKKKRKHLKK